MTEFKHEERLPREQAAERLAEIAFALTVGRTLEVTIAGDLVRCNHTKRMTTTHLLQ
jgi:hypothetical protein